MANNGLDKSGSKVSGFVGCLCNKGLCQQYTAEATYIKGFCNPFSTHDGIIVLLRFPGCLAFRQGDEELTGIIVILDFHAGETFNFFRLFFIGKLPPDDKGVFV